LTTATMSFFPVAESLHYTKTKSLLSFVRRHTRTGLFRKSIQLDVEQKF